MQLSVRRQSSILVDLPFGTDVGGDVGELLFLRLVKLWLIFSTDFLEKSDIVANIASVSMEVGIVYSGKSGFSSDMVDSSSETMSSRESSANKGTVVKGTAVFRGVLGISISSVSSRIEATSWFFVGSESEVISEADD